MAEIRPAEYTIWCDDVLLGRTNLAMPSADARTRAGELEPTPEFGQAWARFGPAFAEFLAAGMALVDMPPAPQGASPEERGRHAHAWLMAHPGTPRLRAAHEAVAALGLELRDPGGRHVPTTLVIIQEVRPPDWIPAAAIEQTLAEAREAGLDIRIPSYAVCAITAVDDSSAMSSLSRA